jgi:hypothetical protein
MMEETIFPSGAVAPILEENYVEARLHTDGDANIERIKQLQEDLTHSVSNPYYVLQEPDSGEVLGTQDSASSKETFKGFLNEALRKRTNAIE